MQKGKYRRNAEYHFDILKEWAQHIAKMNFTAIYIRTVV